jgi:hypothetical protein
MPVLKPPKRFTFINSGKEPLTPKKLKMFEGLEHISDAEAEEILFALKELSRILLSCKLLNDDNMFQ